MLHSKKISVGTALLALALFSWNCGGPTLSSPAPGNASGTYGKDSTIFALCWLAGINTQMQGTPEALQQHAVNGVTAVLTNDTIQDLIGEWKVLWGPVAFTAHATGDSSVTDNTMMLLQGNDPDNPAKTLYVIAIAGTNSGSVFDWEDEDFSIREMVQWPPIPKSGGTQAGVFIHPKLVSDSSTTNQGNYISQGITTGMNNLINNMKDGSKGTLLSYLKSRFSTSYDAVELAVAGHSLGGGLSPVFALALKDWQPYWNFPGTIQVTTYPFAGQSPGNAKFAGYLATRLGAGNFHGLYNTLDMVPHAFNYDMMGEISGLYEGISDSLGKECFIHGVVNCLRKKAGAFQYTSLYGDKHTFTGQVAFDPAVYTQSMAIWPSLPDSTRTKFIESKDVQGCWLDKADKLFARTICFAYMAKAHHTTAYVDYLGVQSFNTIFQRQINKNGKAANILSDPLIYQCLSGS